MFYFQDHLFVINVILETGNKHSLFYTVSVVNFKLQGCKWWGEAGWCGAFDLFVHPDPWKLG